MSLAVRSPWLNRATAVARTRASRETAWGAAIFSASLLVCWMANLPVIQRLSTTGDEPWYLLQAYSLWHHHTVDLARALHDRTVYASFLGGVPDDHTGDPLRNGVRVLPNLPGYAAFIAPLYAWHGRKAILLAQALCAALTATLLFYEARHLLRSTAAALFGAACCILAAPALFYVGQVFPSTLAASLTFTGFVAVSHWLPRARGRWLALATVVLGVVLVALPWVHFKYALTSLALFALGLWALRGRLAATEDARARRRARDGMVALSGAVALSFAGIALYCRHYFGTWTPQVNFFQKTQVDLAHPDLARALWLFSDIFLSPQAGLLPWVPLYFLVPFGLILLWRAARRTAIGICVLLPAQLAFFASSLFSESVYQGYALPARFAVESLPLFALCVAAVVAWCLTAAAPLTRASAELVKQPKPRTLGKSGTARTVTGPFAWSKGAQVVLGGFCVVALAWCVWSARVVIRDPYLWYPARSGPRLVYKYPNDLPQWWFGLFPETPTVWLNYRTADTIPFPHAISIENGARDVASTDWTDIPPGQYNAHFSFACASTDRPPQLAGGTRVELVIERLTGDYPSHTVVMRIADTALPALQCSAATQHATMDIPFTSNGYQRIGFRIFYQKGVDISQSEVSYAKG